MRILKSVRLLLRQTLVYEVEKEGSHADEQDSDSRIIKSGPFASGITDETRHTLSVEEPVPVKDGS